MSAGSITRSPSSPWTPYTDVIIVSIYQLAAPVRYEYRPLPSLSKYSGTPGYILLLSKSIAVSRSVFNTL